MDVDDISTCHKCGFQWLGDDYVHVCPRDVMDNLKGEELKAHQGWQAMVEEPESQSVADLIRSVKFLREELYQQKLKTQEEKKIKEEYVMKWINLEEELRRKDDDGERLQATAARYLGYADDLREAIQNLMGIFDNPVARRRIGGEFADIARQSGREALEKTKELEKK